MDEQDIVETKIPFKERVIADLHELVSSLETSKQTNPFPFVLENVNNKYDTFEIQPTLASHYGFNVESMVLTILREGFTKAKNDNPHSFIATGTLIFYSYYIGNGKYVTEITHSKFQHLAMNSKPILTPQGVLQRIRIDRENDLDNISRTMYIREANRVRRMREDEVNQMKIWIATQEEIPLTFTKILFQNDYDSLRLGFAQYLNRLQFKYDGEKNRYLNTLVSVDFLFMTFPDIPEPFAKLYEGLMIFINKVQRGITYKTFMKILQMHLDITEESNEHRIKNGSGVLHYFNISKQIINNTIENAFVLLMGRRVQYGEIDMIYEITVKGILPQNPTEKILEGVTEKQFTTKLEPHIDF